MIRIDADGRGRWDVSLPEPGAHMMCETIEDARRAARRRAVERRPCELVVRDAYHRVVYSELIGADSASGV